MAYGEQLVRRVEEIQVSPRYPGRQRAQLPAIDCNCVAGGYGRDIDRLIFRRWIVGKIAIFSRRKGAAYRQIAQDGHVKVPNWRAINHLDHGKLRYSCT